VSGPTIELERRFTVAPWPRALKATSALGAILLTGIGIMLYCVIPAPTGFTHFFGLGVALVPASMLVVSLLFTVTGYVVSPTELAIRRLFWATRVPLAGLKSVALEPGVCKGSLRVFGNAGLFAFTGLYENRRLGRFRLFATDLAHSVVFVMDDRTVVITPAASHVFVEHMQRFIAGAKQVTAPG
jgi:hypothetical protein